MLSRPVIGVPTQSLHAIKGMLRHVPDSWVMSQKYFQVLSMMDGIPWMIPLLDEDLATLREIYERLDGIFLAGGVDIHPETYGHEYRRLCNNTDRIRDSVEVRLIRWAMEDSKPILGACRGVQILNVAAGGTLYQDLGAQRPESIRHAYYPEDGFARDFLAHDVSLSPRSRLSEIFGATPVRVNSMHHQAVWEVAPGLVATALAPDGLIEGVEASGDHFLVGVQWHPEALVEKDEATRRLFGEFVEAASDFRQAGRGPRQALRAS